MYLKKISVLNYKNILQADLTLNPKINCFVGNNGMGKTNLLDTIYYLSFCKSHSNAIDNQNINHESDFFVLQGQYDLHGNEEEIYCGLKRRQKKHFKRNKKEYEKLSDHIGLLPLVLISPRDSGLIAEGSEERRKFMDSVISQYDKNYLHTLIQYNNALKQRNALLKNEQLADEALMELWEEQLVENGKIIFEQRLQFIQDFIPIFQKIYQFVSQQNEVVVLNYKSQLKTYDLGEKLRSNRVRDSILGYTTNGIHKDDLEMLLANFPIKRVGSQGQNKTFLIALKLAQFHFLQHTQKVKPILLLDDIFDKLDTSRVKQIVALVANEDFGQIFISDTNATRMNDILTQINQSASIFYVDNGHISL